MIIDKTKEKDILPTKRAPLEREAPLPSVRRRRPMTPGKSKLNELFKNNRSLNFDQNTGFHSGPSAKRKGYRLALWSLLASVIDALILVSISCVFMLTFSMVLHTPLGEIIQTFQTSQHRMIFFSEVMMVAAWIYLISVRGFLGYSIGEWACDLRLGQPHERLSPFYILRVALRSTLILVTGVFLLPVVSMLVGRDVAGFLSGIKLFSLK